MKRELVLVALMALTSVSCSKFKQVDSRTKRMDENTSQMNETTNQMNQTTNKMSNTTEQMKDLTVHMSMTTNELKELTMRMEQTTSYMYPQVRTKEAEDTRSQKMLLLKNPKTGFGEKIAAAAVYFQSFEFSFFTNNGTFDTLETREAMFTDAVNEFFIRVSDIYEEIDLEDMSPSMEGKKYHNELTFYALAAASHFVNFHQINTQKKVGGFEVKSFLDLLEDALIKEKNGEELKMFEDMILAGVNRQITIDLLKARVDMLIGLVIKDSAIIEIDEMSYKEMFSALPKFFSGGKKGKLTSKYEKSNDSTKRDLLMKLDEVLKTVKILRAIDEDIKLSDDISFAVNAIELKQPLNKRDIYTKKFYQIMNQLRSL